jgi:hypothetical protein
MRNSPFNILLTFSAGTKLLVYGFEFGSNVWWISSGMYLPIIACSVWAVSLGFRLKSLCWVSQHTYLITRYVGSYESHDWHFSADASAIL